MMNPSFDLGRIESPAYVIDLGLLRRNLSVLERVQADAGCKILLALKGFAAFSTFPIIRSVLSGAAASSVSEARLAQQYFGKELHAYAPAYSALDIEELVPLIDHIVFNSLSQLERLGPIVRAAAQAQSRNIEIGLRVNPEHRETAVALYDPCAEGSRLGVPERALAGELPAIDGLHFHTLCEKNSDSLERTLAHVEARFSRSIERVKWVNFGGGHLVTRADYDVERLIRVIQQFKARWDKVVYLEPSEAIGWETGWLIATVLDVIDYGQPIAILDVSATAHMPDVLEMPYRPNIVGAAMPGEKAFTYRLGGLTCLAGDVVGDYSFDEPLRVGSKIAFCDMAHYTIVKNTTFNGVRLPSIVTYDPNIDELRIVRRFGYEDYRSRQS
ncbi:MAG TPA: carboxynorspermidine decarboxylase [Polyangiaceae bacterium]